MSKEEEREVMTAQEAEREVGRDFILMDEWMRPLVLCPHKVLVRSGIYDPRELEAIACLVREDGEDLECERCERLRREEGEEEKPKGKKKGKKLKDNY